MHCVATGKAAPIGCMHACHEGMHPEVLSTCTRYSRERNGECMHPCRGSIGVVRWYYASMHVVHASIGHACMHECVHARHPSLCLACVSGTRRARIFAPRCPRPDTCSLTAASYRKLPAACKTGTCHAPISSASVCMPAGSPQVSQLPCSLTCPCS